MVTLDKDHVCFVIHKFGSGKHTLMLSLRKKKKILAATGYGLYDKKPLETTNSPGPTV